MDKLTIIIESSAVGLALIVFGMIILLWQDFSDAIKLIGQGKFIVGGLSLVIGLIILIINRYESASLREE